MDFQPESLSELARFFQYTVSGIEKQLTNISEKVDRLDVVSRDQYREDMQLLRQQRKDEINQVYFELNEQKRDFETFQERMAAHSKWVIGSIIFPIVGFLLTIYSLLHGAGGL